MASKRKRKPIFEPPALKFKQRAEVVTDDVARRRIWQSRCGRYRVVHSQCVLGPRNGPDAVPDVWYALVRQAGQWRLISRHRRRGPAERACLKHFRRQAVKTPRQAWLFRT